MLGFTKNTNPRVKRILKKIDRMGLEDIIFIAAPILIELYIENEKVFPIIIANSDGDMFEIHIKETTEVKNGHE
jgi:hypothetical protein